MAAGRLCNCGRIGLFDDAVSLVKKDGEPRIVDVKRPTPTICHACGMNRDEEPRVIDAVA